MSNILNREIHGRHIGTVVQNEHGPIVNIHELSCQLWLALLGKLVGVSLMFVSPSEECGDVEQCHACDNARGNYPVIRLTSPRGVNTKPVKTAQLINAHQCFNQAPKKESMPNDTAK